MAGSTVAITAMERHLTTMGIQEKDAVSALLGITPDCESSGSRPCLVAEQINQDENDVTNTEHSISAEFFSTTPHGFILGYGYPKSDLGNMLRQGNGTASGLETLAALAEREQNASKHRPLPSFLLPGGVYSGESSSSCSISSQSAGLESMPPPPPRPPGRLRSVSNPEGMEKWDPLLSCQYRSCRRHFVLPASILEEELAEANEAVRQRSRSPLQENPVQEHAKYLHVEESANVNSEKDHLSVEIAFENETENYLESDLTPNELLCRARTQLLEDLSSESVMVNGEKGILTLPHTLTKYKEVYNRNGRIGIYTPSERAAIIARFNDKRTRRNWNKKIRYNCRKSLADRRLRVKGRFVKRSEQDELEKQLQGQGDQEDQRSVPIESYDRPQKRVTICDEVDYRDENTAIYEDDDRFFASGLEPADDEDMPDTNDPDAGFSPTEDQPYRRLRRHTIT